MLSKDKKKEKTNGDEGDKKDKKEKTNGSDSDSSGEECGTVRTHRITTTLRPRITGFTPSPRHSTTSQPVCLYFAYNFYKKNEPRHEKTCVRGFRRSKTQTSMCSLRS